MLRLLFAVVVWVVLLGGVGLFVHATQGAQTRSTVVFTVIDQNLVLELTPTADLGAGDPFAIDAEQTTGTARSGETILATIEPLTQGQSLTIPLLFPAIAGDNELAVQLPAAYLDQPMAVHVILRRGAGVMLERTEWFPAGASYEFFLRWHEAALGEDEHGH